MAPFPLSLPGHDCRLQRQNQAKAEVHYALPKPRCSQELRFIQKIVYFLLPKHNCFTQGEVLGEGNESILDGLDLFPPLHHI